LRNRLGSTVMLEDAETVTGVLTAPLPARCRNARILSVDMPPVIALTAFPVPIAVRFENASGCTWPAVAIPAKGLVGLGYQWIDPEGKEQPPGAFTRLLADVAPGEQVDDTVVVVPPYGEPGTWRLSIFVGQNGEASPLAKVTRPVEVRRLGSAP
jgi:hypothetical protein